MPGSGSLWDDYDPANPPAVFGLPDPQEQRSDEAHIPAPRAAAADEVDVAAATGSFLADVPFDEEPPPEDGMPDWDMSEPPTAEPEPPVAAGGTEDQDLPELILRTLRQVLAAHQGETDEQLMGLISQIRASAAVLELLPEEARTTYKGVFDVLDHEFSGSSRTVDYADVPVARFRSAAVRAELRLLAEFAPAAKAAGNPTAAWAAVVEGVQRAKARRGALDLVRGIDKQLPSEDLVRTFQDISAPTAKRILVTTTPVRSAREWEVEMQRLRAGRDLIRLSSGDYTLDWALTGDGEQLGFMAQGEFTIIAAGTGQGKSASANKVAPSMAWDLCNHGFPEGKIVLAHTEEEVTTKIKAMQLGRGQRNHALADMVEIAPIGSSRKALAQTLYRLVVQAYERSQDTGLPIDNFLPYAVVVDYIQSLAEEREQETEAIARTAEFLLRGVVAWNPEEMAKFSGVDFRTYTGMAWPEGMSHHRVGVVAYAQLIKQEGTALFYKPGSKATPRSNFVLEGPDGEDAWELREGDQRLPTQNELRGSGVMLQNATNLIFLHRSRPHSNPVIRPKVGRPYLRDTRARYLLSKTRNGASLAYVPMKFNSQPSGFRGQYYDFAAEEWIQSGRLQVADVFHESGDPILPLRDKRSPLAGVQY